MIPLPSSSAALARHNTHPGLALDKFVDYEKVTSADQFGKVDFSGSVQRPAVAAVAAMPAPFTAGDFDDLRKRREMMLSALGAKCLRAQTSGPVTLHLARASALENAGLCLHPIYGCAYLPGSGLKGLVRAYAETVEKADSKLILQVFGTTAAKDGSSAGAIVFHDAWPESWPRLMMDIVNNHHPKYYGAGTNDNSHPPGDWENPVPVYFLAVESGTTFSFALSKRRDDVNDESLKNAQEWLLGALCHLGAGAKTAAGYGCFKPVNAHPPALPASARRTFETTLELVTPAFLAGAKQEKEDCTLRPATLRGLLRWWWRIFHVGFVNINQLREMESAVWGSTEAGSAIRLIVEPKARLEPQPCPFKIVRKNAKNQEVLRFDRDFAAKHEIQLADPKQTQGLVYASFGMDEMDAGKPHTRETRWYAPAATQWTLKISARSSHFVLERDRQGRPVKTRELDANLLLNQVRLALWWFSRLGGIGSKARKGFGSCHDLDFPDFQGGMWIDHGAALRKACGLPDSVFDAGQVASPALKQMREMATELELGNWFEVQTPWTDEWRVLDEIGCAMQDFAQAPAATGHGKHCDPKRHLGLPRRIHRPPGQELVSIHGLRHASPIWYHVKRGDSGMIICLCPFPSAGTSAPKTEAQRGWQESRTVLCKLLRHHQEFFLNRQ